MGESVSRAVIEWSGFPPPECQVEFTDEGFTDRVDFFWRRQRSIGESGGYGKYATAGADPLISLRREKTREDLLRRQVDGFSRWDWADTVRVQPLQRKILRAGVPQAYPVQQTMLDALLHNSRSVRR